MCGDGYMRKLVFSLANATQELNLCCTRGACPRRSEERSADGTAAGEDDAADGGFAGDDPAFPVRVRPEGEDAAGRIGPEPGEGGARRAERLRLVVGRGRRSPVRETRHVPCLEFKPGFEGRISDERRAMAAEAEHLDYSGVGVGIEGFADASRQRQVGGASGGPDERGERTEEAHGDDRDIAATAARVSANEARSEGRPSGQEEAEGG